MKIPACAIADLDFAFTEAAKGDSPLVAKNGPEISKAKVILKRIQPTDGFSLAANDLPENKSGFRAADVWALLTLEADGKTLASEIHNILKSRAIWVWKAGSIEQITGTANKGEDAIMECEEALRKMSAGDISQKMAAFVECFEWIKSFKSSSEAIAAAVPLPALPQGPLPQGQRGGCENVERPIARPLPKS